MKLTDWSNSDCEQGEWLKGNDIKTSGSTGSDYWATHVGWAKIKTDGLKQQIQTDVITR